MENNKDDYEELIKELYEYAGYFGLSVPRFSAQM